MLFCIAALCFGERLPTLGQPLSGAMVLMLLGVGGTATIGQLLLTKAFAAGPPAKVSVVGLTQIVFSMCFDIVLWGRTFSPLTLAGMVFIIAPTAWVMLARK
jgi:drug/metabolite transporter (DMT)-like permease